MAPQTPKSFKSSLEVLENGAVVASRTVMVNAPFSYRGYVFYQANYDPDDLSWSALQVVKDPGVPVVYSGFILMMAGLLGSARFCGKVSCPRSMGSSSFRRSTSGEAGLVSILVLTC